MDSENILSAAAEAEMLQLVWSIRDDQTSADQVARLEELVQTHPAARRVYTDLVNLLADLRWQVTPSTKLNVGSEAAAEFASEGRAKEIGNRKSAGMDQKSTSPVLGFLGRTTSALTRSVLNRPIVWSITTVAVVFYGTFAFISWNLRSGKLPSVATNTIDTSVAVVRGASGVHWSKGTALSAPASPILPGEPLTIESGIVQLELNRGVTLVVEGPARWSIVDDNHAKLESGKIVAKVPLPAVGFTLDTPTARIVDLGTEFAAETTAAGETDVHVLAGKVALSPNSAETKSSERIVLRAGMARRVASGSTGREFTIREIPNEPARFARQVAVAGSKRLNIRGVLASSEYGGTEARHLIDGSGLRGEGHIDLPEGTMWVTNPGKVKGEFVLFDLGRLYRLDTMKVWNFNQNRQGDPPGLPLPRYALYTSRGIGQADIYVSKTGKWDPISHPQDWQLIEADRKFAAADGTQDYSTPEKVALGGVEARYVGIVIDSNLKPDPRPDSKPEQECVGLSEVQIFGDRLEPATPKEPRSP